MVLPIVHFCCKDSPKSVFLPSFDALLKSVKIRTSATRDEKTKEKRLHNTSLLSSQRSYFSISHLQELGVDISGTLPFLVEQELVVAAVSTNGYDSIGLCSKGTHTGRA